MGTILTVNQVENGYIITGITPQTQEHKNYIATTKEEIISIITIIFSN